MAGKNIEAIYRLTPLQEGILFHTLESPGSGVYFEQFACTLHGDLDVERLRRAWEAALARHAALRTLFTWEKRDKPLQIVRRRVDLPFEAFDWRDLDDSAQRARLAAWLRLDRDRGFDLEKAPLTRITLIRTGDDRQRMVWSFHHLLIDGWSMRLVLDEVLSDYDALARGEPTGPVAPSFADFVTWLERRDEDRGRRFFRDMLAGFRSPTCPETGPADRDAHRAGDPNGMRERRLPESLYARLGEVARAHRLTLNTLVTGAWALLLARLCGRDDVVFGTTLAGRPPDLANVERTAGLFINTLPLRVRVEDDRPLGDLLQAVQKRQVAMREVAQSALPLARRASDVPPGTPLFETIVVFENFPPRDDGSPRGLELSDEHYVEYSNFPLALLAVPDDTLTLYAVHDPRRFGAAAVDRMLAQVETLLGLMADGLDTPAGQATLLDAASVDRLTREWNATDVDLGPAEPVHALFEAQARNAPDAVAVIDAAGEVCYGELNARANRLAHRLIAEGATGRPVVVYAQRGAAAIAGILATLKAGAAYVPMDADYPAERLRLVLDDLGTDSTPVVLTESPLRERVGDGAHVIDLDSSLADGRDDDPALDIDPESLAYLIYTSGSTGRPKGVMVSHANLYNSTRARDHYYGEPPKAWLLLSSLATDSSVAGVFWSLTSRTSRRSPQWCATPASATYSAYPRCMP